MATFHTMRHLEACKCLYDSESWSSKRKIGATVHTRFRKSILASRWDYEDFDLEAKQLAGLPLGHEYGVSVSSPMNVMEIIKEIPGARIIAYIEHGWADHQDVAAFQINA